MKGDHIQHRVFVALSLVLVLLGGFVAGPVRAQEAALDKVQEAFAAGDADALIGEAADRVEIALLGRSKLYSRAQATYVMEDFFRRYPPETFTLKNNAQDNGSWFATGRYQYKHAEQPLQVYLRLHLKDQQWQLREIRIEQRQGG